jgi:hypothetical protein
MKIWSRRSPIGLLQIPHWKGKQGRSQHSKQSNTSRKGPLSKVGRQILWADGTSWTSRKTIKNSKKKKEVKLSLKNKTKQDWGCNSVIECLPRICKALGSIPDTIKHTKTKIKQKTGPNFFHNSNFCTLYMSPNQASLKTLPGCSSSSYGLPRLLLSAFMVESCCNWDYKREKNFWF